MFKFATYSPYVTRALSYVGYFRKWVPVAVIAKYKDHCYVALETMTGLIFTFNCAVREVAIDTL